MYANRSRCSSEVFAGDGARAMAIRVIPIQSHRLAAATRPGDPILRLDGAGGVATDGTLVVNSGPNGPLGDVETVRVTSIRAAASDADPGPAVSVTPAPGRSWPAGTLVSNEPGYGVAVFATRGDATLRSLDVWQMRSAW